MDLDPSTLERYVKIYQMLSDSLKRDFTIRVLCWKLNAAINQHQMTFPFVNLNATIQPFAFRQDGMDIPTNRKNV